MGSGSSTSNSRGRIRAIEDSILSAYTWLVTENTDVRTYDPEASGGENEVSENEEEQPKVEEPENGPARPASILQVTGADLNVEQNVTNHRTAIYDVTRVHNDDGDIQTPRLIVRRGDTFDVTLVLNRKYSPEHDKVMVYLQTGNTPSIGKGTFLTLNVTKGVNSVRDWGAAVESSNAKSLTVRIRPAPDAIIGRWTLSFHTSFKKTPETERRIENRYQHPHLIYILFNAWCKNDQVYMEDESLRKEYVMNPDGKIFSGNYKQITYRPWTFGQFEEEVLDCVLDLLGKSRLKDHAKWDPVKIARTISAAVNSQDDNGILVGNWSGDYDSGTAPTTWTGSVKILEQYHRTKRPVMYGQCWVFSGLVTTVCRALGIPTRSVTNFSSAHDTDGSTTIDFFYKRTYNAETEDYVREPIESLNNDSIWNFHVWNEAWMTRPDLESGFGGWQAFDATPQEASDNIYQAGPASVKAIKEGLVNNNYDTTFIFSEVNADVVSTIIHDAETKKQNVYSEHVGRFISTKYPEEYEPDDSVDGRMDITHDYKYPEGTESERAAVKKARTHAKKAPVIKDLEPNDVDFEIFEKDHILVGSSFDVILKIKNKSSSVRTISGTIYVNTIHYTGVVHAKVKKMDFKLQLQSLKGDDVVCRVSMEEYLHLLVDQASFSVDVIAEVEETNKEIAIQDIYRLRRPDLDVDAPSKVKLGSSFTVVVKLENPMPDPLTQCSWNIEGAGLVKPRSFEQADVGPYDKVEFRVPIPAKKLGKKTVNVSFDSKELRDVTGTCKVEVIA